MKMKKPDPEKSSERILCVLTCPKEEGQPFAVSVYAVGADKPHRVLKAESSRDEISAFLKIVQDGGQASEQTAQACVSDRCITTAGI